MQIRHAVPSDAESIAGIHASSWRNTYNAVLSPKYLNEVVPSERRQVWNDRLTAPNPNQMVLVAEVDEGIVGFACVFARNHDAWGAYLDNLHVNANHQSHGIGRALLTKVAHWCETTAPGNGLYLSVNQANVRAQQFYLGLGAQNVEPGTWNAPDGSKVPTYWFRWHSIISLANTANPAFQRTASGDR